MRVWDPAFERECHGLVIELCDATRPRAVRDHAWQALLERVAPRIEGWAVRSSLLARARLQSDDDARTVMVEAIAKLCDQDFANLRAYLARQPVDEAAAAEATLIETVARLSAPDDGAAANGDGEVLAGTPLRGWLVNLTRFEVKDHVKRRMGWAERGDGAAPSRRDVHSQADRLSDVPERGERPAFTDLLTLKRVVGEIHAYVEDFPPAMRRAVRAWLGDAGFDEIAAELDLDVDAARALVRAALARLRERFRGEWPDVFASD